MKISIILPYEDVEKTEYFAVSEREVDFEKDFEEATKVTVTFAATELKRYLEKVLKETDIQYVNQESDGLFVKLEVVSSNCEEDDYRLIPRENGIVIRGNGRSGVLYGVYEFLKIQGFRWFAPGEVGEIIPPNLQNLILPEKEIVFVPDMNAGRGFDLEGAMPESNLIWYWMARNRFNYGVCRTDYVPLQRKLCIKFKQGGHVLTQIVNPDKVLENGNTLWEEHPEWYGKVEGRITTKENALHCQLCVSNDALNEFIADEIIKRTTRDWPKTDKIDIWGLDIWNNICSCEKCKALGNGSDHALYMLSKIRSKINESNLKKNLRIGTLAYDGTATMVPPTKPIPQNLIDAGDYISFYPITRCYKHFIDTDGCQENERYYKTIQAWNSLEPTMPMMVGEYYNVSRFSDLPILFNRTIDHDIQFYYKSGVRGMTYMHFPTVDLGIRSITQQLYSHLCWDVNADKEAIIDDFYKKSYEQYADKMRDVYELVEKAWSDCSQLRTWGRQDKYNSILGQLYRWDGRVPQKVLDLYEHYENMDEVITRCGESIEYLEKALEIIRNIRKEILYHGYNGVLTVRTVVNPEDIKIDSKNNGYEYKIAEDMRQLSYGLDTMRIMQVMVEYYNALYTKSSTEKILDRMEDLYNKMEGYFVPHAVAHTSVGLFMPDALARTLLRGLIKRCFYLKGMKIKDKD